MATVYKKISTQSVKNRQLAQASNDDASKASNIISSFINLFKQKHLS